MVKRILGTLALLLACAAPLSAQVRYTSHMAVRTAGGGDQLSAMMGNAMAQVYPPEGVDQVIYMGDLGMRTEVKQAMAGMPAGTVLLTKADGSKFGFDPAARTFWKIPATSPDALSALGAQPTVKVTKSGQFETINGMKAEKVVVTIDIPLPGVDPASLPPGFPSSLNMTMTAWLTDAVKTPKNQTAIDLGALERFGGGALKELAGDGRFAVKTLMQGFGIEMETTTRDVTTVELTASMFVVPDGFKEIPPPQPRIGG